ncbi:hypothetical protein G6F55_011730 [Rhizopus delemar]|uniref:Uncharacterized protein n=2 Tax=Rhizopus TaxID=4842 RepID=I1CG50_RHIO9|nr:hypothetical protein RO3G_12141 [Rhizopus delemar RA 99-880]KAG1445985.1 hypothetical protein G6F55_011730 [Rhizopus delemar]KAG1534166.1 hypothetical protein G6F51_012247 [Rhizopus arrhizus]KAG1497194.1 hypothetical protein G6F53_012024 [Rhizopus delemar]KAG1511601.1 hypothetical protein G6F52_010609 [Rhizopus delemar]|eukprot:EIE87430.1 hypothetical protein RO3G_12141 [Rhizopus delemar RA 99-880]
MSDLTKPPSKSVQKAERAVKRKFQQIYKDVKGEKPDKKRGDAVNWRLLLEEAYCKEQVAIGGHRALGALGVSLSNAASSLANANRLSPPRNVSSSTDEENISIDFSQKSRIILTNGFDIGSTWDGFKRMTYNKAKMEGLSTVTDVIEVLALNHVMLLTLSKNNVLVNFLGQDIYESLMEMVLSRYFNAEIVIETEITNAISGIIASLVSEDIDRKTAKIQLINITAQTEKYDTALIDMVTSCITKLPKKKLDLVVGEQELITGYLDHILTSLFHNPDEQRFFRWANRKSEEFGQLNTKRPDACMSLIENAAGVHALGFVEVKPKDTKDIGLVKLDLIRLGQFWKDVIDQNKIKSVMAVQAVDLNVRVYICSHADDGFYPMLELCCFDAPSCLDELPSFLQHLTNLKKVIYAYDNCCVRIDDESSKAWRRPSLTKGQLEAILK